MEIEPKIMSQVKSILGDFGNKYLTRSDLSGFYLKLNVRNFLYNLYFRLRYNNVGITLQKEIEKVLDSIRDF